MQRKTTWGFVTLGRGAFGSCDSLDEVDLPASLVNLGSEAFGFTAIKSISVPDSVQDLGRETFSYCSQLATVNLGSGLKTIGSLAFDSCGALTSINFPEGLEEIGKQAFVDSGLTGHIALPASCTRLYDECFADTGLEEIEASGPLDYLGRNFMPESCVYKDMNGQEHNLQDLFLEKDNFVYAFLSDEEAGLLQIDMGTVPDNGDPYEFPAEIEDRKIVSISCDVPDSCNKYIFPDSVRLISGNIFQYMDLEEVVLPASLKRIDHNAFDQASLPSLTIPEGVEHINPSALSKVQKVTFAGSAAEWEALWPDDQPHIEVSFKK